MKVFTLLVLSALVATSAAAEPRLAPDVEMKTLTGDVVSLAEEPAPVTIVDFWATWCKPCVRALPELQKLHERYADEGLAVVGVSIDGPRNFAKVRPFAKRLDIGYPIALDRDGSLQRRFRVTSVPTLFVVDSERVVRHLKVGYRPGDEVEVEAIVRDLLGLPPLPEDE